MISGLYAEIMLNLQQLTCTVALPPGLVRAAATRLPRIIAAVSTVSSLDFHHLIGEWWLWRLLDVDFLRERLINKLLLGVKTLSPVHLWAPLSTQYPIPATPSPTTQNKPWRVFIALDFISSNEQEDHWCICIEDVSEHHKVKIDVRDRQWE